MDRIPAVALIATLALSVLAPPAATAQQTGKALLLRADRAIE